MISKLNSRMNQKPKMASKTTLNSYTSIKGRLERWSPSVLFVWNVSSTWASDSIMDIIDQGPTKIDRWHPVRVEKSFAIMVETYNSGKRKVWFSQYIRSQIVVEEDLDFELIEEKEGKSMKDLTVRIDLRSDPSFIRVQEGSQRIVYLNSASNLGLFWWRWICLFIAVSIRLSVNFCNRCFGCNLILRLFFESRVNSNLISNRLFRFKYHHSSTFIKLDLIQYFYLKLGWSSFWFEPGIKKILTCN